MKKFLAPVLVFAGLCAPSAGHAATVGEPEQNRAAKPASKVDLAIATPLTIGSPSPAFGSAMLAAPDESTFASLAGVPPAQSPDFAASFKTQLYGVQTGLSAGFTNGGSLFLAAPTTGWNVGASVGYAGFYFHAGISDAGEPRLTLTNDPSKGWLAGLGYQTGGLNVRFSYMTAQTPVTGDGDARTWMIGGVYQLSNRLRLNADAFTSRDRHLDAVATPPPASGNAAPQGTGARVGVQLRF